MKGFLNINKPVGFSSAKVVAIAKQKLGLTKKDKIGHMGTLDPQASGVLPIAVGRATRLFDYLLSKSKTYIAEFTFGYMTDTLDREGAIVKKCDKIPTKEEILAVLPKFLGEIEQLPPQFSAKSVNGIRAYEFARKGQNVELKICKINIEKFDLIEQINPNCFKFEIKCGSGTYIRSLCRDLAEKVDSLATMTSLCRVQTGVFLLENAISIDDINEKELLPIDIVLQNIEKFDISKQDYQDLMNGKRVTFEKNIGMYRLFFEDNLVGICNIDEQKTAKMKIWL